MKNILIGGIIISILIIETGCETKKSSQEIMLELVKVKQEEKRLLHVNKVHEYAHQLYRENKEKTIIVGLKKEDDLIRFDSMEQAMNNLIKLEPDNKTYQRLLQETKEFQKKLYYTIRNDKK